ncbi:unnamed protein product [Adineta steineri]|uniref:G-protein coupled receptors family 1 profile domain-containing protein n=1 Tax=Adineta steineri TaxID=433720 RepID=A0A813YTP7_9BILA|nr:unnamed protein product [Adineta steineri]CAF0889663.1 unnamed protein product [Adineta steineri]
MFRSNQCAYYLKLEAMTDIGFLLALLPTTIISDFLHTSLTGQSNVWCKIQMMFAYGCGLYSLCTISFLAFDHYLFTNHRLNWRQTSTIKLAHRLTYVNLVLALIHGLIFLIYAENGRSGCTIYHPVLIIYFTYFYYPVLSGALPILISSVFSLLAYRNVRRIIRRQLPVVRRRLDRQMTALALARVLSLCIFATPFLACSLWRLNTVYADDDNVSWAVLVTISVIAYSLLYFNYSINFFVFLFISSRFRHQVKYFFTKKCWYYLTNLYRFSLTLPATNQVVPEMGQEPVSILESVS